MNTEGIDWLGWAATAVFVGSYFFRRPATLRQPSTKATNTVR
jgi:hypothetical protein